MVVVVVSIIVLILIVSGNTANFQSDLVPLVLVVPGHEDLESTQDDDYHGAGHHYPELGRICLGGHQVLIDLLSQNRDDPGEDGVDPRFLCVTGTIQTQSFAFVVSDEPFDLDGSA